ncbi:MAG: sensor histidine kinase [Desulfobacterales bacterium]|jgi:Na+/proline symporter/signal transduction histidine kinase|nr:sensor histidine kinase [Desulfobacterales bacterium]
MPAAGIIFTISICYIGLLFAIAYYGDKRADAGRSIISNPYIYALSLAVYCTAWTFYGSVGRAAQNGAEFLTIYIGPTLMVTLGLFVLRKVVRISKIHRITSIADLISSRYGKSALLGSIVTIIAVIGIIPYISLQLKAISTSFFLIKQYSATAISSDLKALSSFQHTPLFVTLLLALFAILFGTRHLDVTERHEGLVAAIAFESIVKLLAFLSVGVFVTYGLYNGFGDLFSKAQSVPEISKLFLIDTQSSPYNRWFCYIFLSMLAILMLPRQFQVAVVENVNEAHIQKAIWLFPLYLLAINIFVFPVTFSGLLRLQGTRIDADWFILALPMIENQMGLTLIVFIGGMSAATGMVIVETIALSTMICNELVMPVLLRIRRFQLAQRKDMIFLLLTIRRVSILVVLLLGHAYFLLTGGFYALVSIGLVSFAAVAQFAPAFIGGIFWKGGTRSGAMAGLLAGFFVWAYTLVLPSLVQAGLMPLSLLTEGPFGIRLLRPFHLFGLESFDQISHAVFWSMLANVTMYVGVSLFSRPSLIEQIQANLFVDVFKHSGEMGKTALCRGTALVPDLGSLLERFIGPQKAEEALSQYLGKNNISFSQDLTADANLVSYVETLLGGTIGAASAHILVASVIKEEPFGFEEVLGILDETRQVIAYSRELEKATSELKAANERLKELDRLKDEFISTITHELRTPLTSIRSLAEILNTTPDLEKDQHASFTAIIIKESERLTRLIGQVLDIEKIESDRMGFQSVKIDSRRLIQDAVTATHQLVKEKKLRLNVALPNRAPFIVGDRDLLIQVMVNLISNAVKFSDKAEDFIHIRLAIQNGELLISVMDNGIGIAPKDQQAIFKKFHQVKDSTRGRPPGSGLGLSISKSIIERHGGKIWVESSEGKGATFFFTLPVSD